jgi:ATP-binding cassette subfamily B protein
MNACRPTSSNKTAAALDLECYDNPNFYNDFVWAISEADSRAIKVAEDMGKIINRVISTAAIIGVLLSVDILIVLAICFSVSLTVFLKLRKTRIQLDRDTEIKPEQRKSDYIGRVFYLSDYAKELRLSNAQQVLTDKFDESSQSIVKSLKSYGSRLFLLGTTRSICTSMLFDIGITVLLTYKMMVQNAISLGDFAASVAGTWKLFWQINNLMEYITGLYEHSLYAERFRTFLSYKARVADTEASEDIGEPFSGLSVNNLSFTYPGSESAALSDISLSVRPGEKIAFVGYNGAGKSTLIKLLLRLYDPDAGEIRMNGRDIKDYAIRSYRSKFGAVFQDYRIYAATVAENVLADLYNESNEAQVIKALHLSGFDGKLSGLKTEYLHRLQRNLTKTAKSCPPEKRRKSLSHGLLRSSAKS